MFRSMGHWIKKNWHSLCIFLFFWIVLSGILLSIADYFYDSINLLDTTTKTKNSTIDVFHAVEIVILTGMLVYGAWIQLETLNKSAKADFLMRLDDRYGSEPIIKARQIIQRLYRESKIENPDKDEIIHRYYIAKRIDEISEDINLSEEYIYLLNLLDFLESISFFANRGDITLEDIQDMMGLSLDFFYIIFKPRINARRIKYSDAAFYLEFEKLVTKVKMNSLKA